MRERKVTKSQHFFFHVKVTNMPSQSHYLNYSSKMYETSLHTLQPDQDLNQKQSTRRSFP